MYKEQGTDLTLDDILVQIVNLTILAQTKRLD